MFTEAMAGKRASWKSQIEALDIADQGELAQPSGDLESDAFDRSDISDGRLASLGPLGGGVSATTAQAKLAKAGL